MKKAFLTILFFLLTSFFGVVLVAISFISADFTLLAVPRYLLILAISFILNVIAWHIFNRKHVDRKFNVSSMSLIYVNFIIASLLIGLSALTYILMQRDGTYTLDEMMRRPAIFLAVGCLYLGSAIGLLFVYKRAISVKK